MDGTDAPLTLTAIEQAQHLLGLQGLTRMGAAGAMGAGVTTRNGTSVITLRAGELRFSGGMP